MSYSGTHGHAYHSYGIDSQRGAVVVVRPDQRKLSLFRTFPSPSHAAFMIASGLGFAAEVTMAAELLGV